MTPEPEVVEGVAVEVPPERAVVVAPQTQVILGSAALALMSDADFERNLGALEVARRRADRIKLALMAEGTDFGTVPGVKKAFLWKSGAETLDKAFGLVATFTVARVPGASADEPPYSFHAHCYVHLGTADGPVVGEGFGTCNPWEARYRYRKAERVCPACGEPTVIKGQEQYGGGWLCWKKKGGCGAKWPDGAQVIESQDAGQVDNPDPWDLENTIAKMAEKRAHVDGTIRATGTSGLFTQDDDSPAVRAEARPHADRVESDGSLIGTAEATDKQSTDFALRQTPDGPVLGFRLAGDGGRVQVRCRGALAVQLDAFREAVVGRVVTCWGTVSEESFTLRGQDRPVAYRVLSAVRVRVPEVGDLPTGGPANAQARTEEEEIDALVW